MPTFTAPVDLVVPPVQAPGMDDPLAYSLFRWYQNDRRARNVYILTDGTVSEEFPVALYDAAGVLLARGDERVRRAFTGGGTHQVNAAEAAILVGAGYTIV